MPATFFPSARDGRVASRNNLIIFREIRDVEEAILIAQLAGAFDVTISSTLMTYEPLVGPTAYTPALGVTYPAIEYWRAWQGFNDARVLIERMNTVIKYFVDLDYSIVRKTNQVSLDSFDLIIKW